MPKLWTDTIESHRRDVRNAILETTWALATEHGPLSLTMSRIAGQAGIGRATLYKYFPDVETILAACHERHVASHIARLTELCDEFSDASERLRAVLDAYALISHHRGRHGSDELMQFVHSGENVAKAQNQVLELISGLLTEVAAVGELRSDVPPVELANFCVNALGASRSLPSEAAVRRLVMVVAEALLSSAVTAGTLTEEAGRVEE